MGHFPHIAMEVVMIVDLHGTYIFISLFFALISLQNCSCIVLLFTWCYGRLKKKRSFKCYQPGRAVKEYWIC